MGEGSGHLGALACRHGEAHDGGRYFYRYQAHVRSTTVGDAGTQRLGRGVMPAPGAVCVG